MNLSETNREELRAIVYKALHILMGEDPLPEVPIVGPDRRVYGYFLSPLRRKELTMTPERRAKIEERKPIEERNG